MVDASCSLRACIARVPGLRDWTWPLTNQLIPPATCTSRLDFLSQQLRRCTGSSEDSLHHTSSFVLDTSDSPIEFDSCAMRCLQSHQGIPLLKNCPEPHHCAGKSAVIQSLVRWSSHAAKYGRDLLRLEMGKVHE